MSIRFIKVPYSETFIGTRSNEESFLGEEIDACDATPVGFFGENFSAILVLNVENSKRIVWRGGE